MTDTTAPRTTGAIAAGLATVAADGTVLDTWFPAPELSAEPGPAGTERLSAEKAVELLGEGAAKAIGPDAPPPRAGRPPPPPARSGGRPRRPSNCSARAPPRRSARTPAVASR